MIDVPEEVKQACNSDSVTFREIIVVDEQEVVTKVKFSDDTYQNGNFIGTFIMKTIEFDAENNIDYMKKEVIYYREINGIRFKMGTFIVQDIKDNDTKESVTVTAYDYGLKFANPYVTELDYKNTKVAMKDVINEVCTKVGVPLANITFTNENFVVDSNQFTEDSQYGDVVKAVAQMSGTFAKINENDELEFIFDQTSENIEEIEDYTELEDKRDTKPITIVELGMSQVTGQNVVMRWAEGIAIYGENKLVINDNPFAYTQAKRTQLIEGIFNKVKGFGYSSFTTKKTFKPYSQVGDLVKLKNKEGQWINSIILRINTNHQDIELSAPSVIDSTVEYQQPATAEEIANRAELKVDQSEKTIQALVTSNSELVQKTSQLEIDVDTIKGQISEVADVTITADGYGTINVENINQSEPIMIRIYPTSEDITPLRPRVGLYPRVGLRPHSRELIFTRTDNEDEPFSVEYNIPADLYKLDNYYDEFILDYENQRCYINRNIGIDENGEKYLLEIPTVEEYEYPTLELLEGNYKIYMPAFENGYIFVRLMTKNIYTSQFATKVELNSKITQTSSEINLSVDKKLENYSTTQEMNSAIAITASGIQQEVNKKVGEDELGTKIQQNYESVQIAWNKISEFIQFINAELQILNNNKKKLMTLDKVGQHFYDNLGKQIGDIGLIESSSEKQISFAINGDNPGNSMVWGIKKTRNGTITFFPIFRYGDYNTQIGTEYGGLFTLEAPILMQKNTIFLGTDTSTNSPQIFATEVSGNTGYVTIKTEKGFEIRNSSNYVIFSIDRGYFKLGELIESYLNVSGEYVSHFLGTVNIDNDLVCNGNAYLKNVPVSDDIYSISGMPDSFFSAYFNQGGSVFLYTTSSDKNLKYNIKDSEEYAIDKIKKIKHRQFDWKSNNEHQGIGYIAQEMEEIDKKFVHHNIIKDKEGKTKEDWQINVLNVLSTATKAIQEIEEDRIQDKKIIKEQQKTIEELQEKIKEMEEKINGKN